MQLHPSRPYSFAFLVASTFLLILPSLAAIPVSSGVISTQTKPARQDPSRTSTTVKTTIGTTNRQFFLAIGIVELIELASAAAAPGIAATAEAAEAATAVVADATELAEVAETEVEPEVMEEVAIRTSRHISRNIGRMRANVENYNVPVDPAPLRQTAQSFRAFSGAVRSSSNGEQAGSLAMIEEAGKLGGENGALQDLCNILFALHNGLL